MLAALSTDPMDQLITLLRHNARASIEDLARELDVSEATVAKRIAELERDGVILRYITVLDPQKVSADSVTATIEVRIRSCIRLRLSCSRASARS